MSKTIAPCPIPAEELMALISTWRQRARKKFAEAEKASGKVLPASYQIPLMIQHQSAQPPKIESNSTALSTGSYW